MLIKQIYYLQLIIKSWVKLNVIVRGLVFRAVVILFVMVLGMYQENSGFSSELDGCIAAAGNISLKLL